MASGQGNTSNSRNRAAQQQQQAASELTEEDGLMREVSLSSSSTSSSGGGGVAARVLRRGGTNTNNHTRVTARRQYNRISTGDDEEEADDEEANRNSNRGNDSSASVDNDERRRLRCGAENNNGGTKSAGADEDDEDDDEKKTVVLEEEDDDDGRRISVVILDFAQHRFRVSVNPCWSVGTLKRVGCAVHKVSPALQRLIFRGKLLSDDETTLESLSIVEDDVIVHLFPKPRVVIQSSQQQANSATTGCTAAGAVDDGDGADEENGGGGGAHVPTIVLDAEEAERRSQILVLGAPDYVETQNNVRLFSFMLMIISSIELLNLLAIALGVPQDETNTENGSEMPSIGLNDDLFAPPSSHHNNNHTANGGGGEEYPSSDISLYQEWGPAKYVDLMISSLGVYVAILGLKATTENTRRLATAYLWGVFTTGVCWMMFNYFISLQIDEAVEEERQTEYPDDDVMNPKLSQTDLYYQAATVMILPGMVWILCCIRAYQFQRLLHEAEQEAEERIRQELTNVTGGGGNTTAGGDETDQETTTTAAAERGGGGQTTASSGSGRTAAVSAVNHDEELALQNDRERYTIT